MDGCPPAFFWFCRPSRLLLPRSWWLWPPPQRLSRPRPRLCRLTWPCSRRHRWPRRRRRRLRRLGRWWTESPTPTCCSWWMHLGCTWLCVLEVPFRCLERCSKRTATIFEGSPELAYLNRYSNNFCNRCCWLSKRFSVQHAAQKLWAWGPRDPSPLQTMAGRAPISFMVVFLVVSLKKNKTQTRGILKKY